MQSLMILMCDVTSWDMPHSWLTHMSDTTHSYVWHESFMCITWIFQAFSPVSAWRVSPATYISMCHVTRMSHVTHLNESRCKSSKSKAIRMANDHHNSHHAWTSHVTHMNEWWSPQIYHLCMRHVIHITHRMSHAMNVLLLAERYADASASHLIRDLPLSLDDEPVLYVNVKKVSSGVKSPEWKGKLQLVATAQGCFRESLFLQQLNVQIGKDELINS